MVESEEIFELIVVLTYNFFEIFEKNTGTFMCLKINTVQGCSSQEILEGVSMRTKKFSRERYSLGARKFLSVGTETFRLRKKGPLGAKKFWKEGSLGS